jgi:hypothetical protein
MKHKSWGVGEETRGFGNGKGIPEQLEGVETVGIGRKREEKGDIITHLALKEKQVAHQHGWPSELENVVGATEADICGEVV